ncbi:6-O-methylguanine DNA methyltransferase [Powellomyces hirtus]|nr:6-O-methylguanine DNA methyltransferase [Powellomyces hirtus]
MSTEREEFRNSVLDVVRRIPEGRITSYAFMTGMISSGHIAKLVGKPNHARHVGNVLKESGGLGAIPWQRVVNRDGFISPRVPESQMALQATLLQQEGVAIEEDGLGLFWADMNLFGWFPQTLAAF